MVSGNFDMDEMCNFLFEVEVSFKLFNIFSGV